MYGLETIQLKRQEKTRLDAFQIKGLRRILKLPPTFEDRFYTNDKGIEMASVELGRPILLFTESQEKLIFVKSRFPALLFKFIEILQSTGKS